MADLSVGDILINLETQSKNIDLQLDKTVKHLRTFKNVLVALEKVDIGKINKNLSEISKMDFKGLRNLMEAIGYRTVQKTNNNLKNTNKQLDNMNDKSKKTDKSFSSLFSLGRIYFFLNYTKRIAQSFVNIFNYAIDFEETLNKFTVSFGEYSEEAKKFANEMAYAFNLSTESIMDYMSTFNNMLSALGSLDISQSSKLSQTLTRMAVDYASLFNVSVATAMTQFQSVLSGSIRPVRSTSGYDVSETTIFQLYQQLGGTKTMRQLSQLEKRLLRILAIQKQMETTGAVEDFSSTINNTANQLKQISETLQEIGRYMGTVLLYYFKDVIEGALTLLIVVKDITKALAQGFQNEIQIGGGNLFENIVEGADEANESLDKLSNKLLSFDKFEALNPSNTSQTSDLQNILNSIGEYTSSLAEITSQARQTADSILLWLGYTKEFNELTGETNWKLKEGYTNIEKITDILSIIAGATLISGLAKIGALLSSISLSVTFLGGALSSLVIVGIIKLFNIIDGMDTKGKAFTGTLLALAGSVMTLTVAFTALKAVATGASFLTFLPLILAGIGVFSAGLYGMISAGKEMSNAKKIQLGTNFSGYYADGGFPTRGSLFVANEAGAELVGNIGGKTAVANNDMIVQAIENASYRGMVKALAVQGSNRDVIEFDFTNASDGKVARALAQPMIDELTRQGYKIQKN